MSVTTSFYHSIWILFGKSNLSSFALQHYFSWFTLRKCSLAPSGDEKFFFSYNRVEIDKEIDQMKQDATFRKDF